MGLYDDFVVLLPEDRRDAFKAAVSALDGAVKIDSREVAEKLIRENPFAKSALDAEISRAVNSHDEKFKAEKLPGLLEDELKKRAPKPKDPELAAALERVEALEKAKKEAEESANTSRQRARVAGKLAELGLSEKMADLFIGKDDAETDAKFSDMFVPEFEKSRTTHAEKIIKERFGNQPPPRFGGPPASNKQQLQERYNELLRAGRRDEANRIYLEMSKLKE